MCCSCFRDAFCDGRFDCADGSDEHDCDGTVLDDENKQSMTILNLHYDQQQSILHWDKQNGSLASSTNQFNVFVGLNWTDLIANKYSISINLL